MTDDDDLDYPDPEWLEEPTRAPLVARYLIDHGQPLTDPPKPTPHRSTHRDRPGFCPLPEVVAWCDLTPDQARDRFTFGPQHPIYRAALDQGHDRATYDFCCILVAALRQAGKTPRIWAILAAVTRHLGTLEPNTFAIARAAIRDLPYSSRGPFYDGPWVTQREKS